VKARDLLIAALLLVLIGLAAADALRDGGQSDSSRSTAQTNTETGPAEIPSRFPRVPARGRLVFLDDDGCRMHEVQVSTGEALELPPLETGCELWTAPHGERIAYALPAPRAALQPFRFLDLSFPLRRLGAFATSTGVLLSQDGLTGAWCEGPRGFVVELGDETPDELDACPAAFTPAGALAFITPRGLRVGDRLIARTRDPLVGAVWGSDGSLLLRYRKRVERLVGGRVRDRARLPAHIRDRPATFAPDTCAAIFTGGEGELVGFDICSGAGQLGSSRASAAAWSPDGEWIALAEDDGIVFGRIGGSSQAATRWPVRARALAWLG